MCNNRQIMYVSIPPVTISPGHTPGDVPFFSYWAVYSQPPGMQKETISFPWDSPLVTHCTHTQKRNNAAFCVQNQDNNIYFCEKPYQKHTLQIVPLHQNLSFTINLAFPALYGVYRYSYQLRTLLLQVQFMPQAHSIHLNFPNKSDLTYRPNVLILKQETCFARTIFQFAPPPYHRDKAASDYSPPPGPKGQTCHVGCPGGWLQVELKQT